MAARTWRRAALTLLFLFLLFAWIASWFPQETKDDQKVVKGKAALVDEIFAREASQLMLVGVNLGILASRNGQSPEVRRLGQELFEESAMFGSQLGMIISEMGIRPDGKLNARDELLVRRLSQLRGRSFDCVFVAEVARRHSRASAVFYRVLTAGEEEGLRALATEALPRFSLRLREARNLKNRLCPSETFPRASRI